MSRDENKGGGNVPPKLQCNALKEAIFPGGNPLREKRAILNCVYGCFSRASERVRGPTAINTTAPSYRGYKAFRGLNHGKKGHYLRLNRPRSGAPESLLNARLCKCTRVPRAGMRVTAAPRKLVISYERKYSLLASLI